MKNIFWSTPDFCVRELKPPRNNSENYLRSILSIFLVKTMPTPKYVLPNYFEVGASFSQIILSGSYFHVCELF